MEFSSQQLVQEMLSLLSPDAPSLALKQRVPRSTADVTDFASLLTIEMRMVPVSGSLDAARKISLFPLKFENSSLSVSYEMLSPMAAIVESAETLKGTSITSPALAVLFPSRW